MNKLVAQLVKSAVELKGHTQFERLSFLLTKLAKSDKDVAKAMPTIREAAIGLHEACPIPKYVDSLLPYKERKSPAAEVRKLMKEHGLSQEDVEGILKKAVAEKKQTSKAAK